MQLSVKCPTDCVFISMEIVEALCLLNTLNIRDRDKLRQQKTVIYRASVWKTIESKLTISINDIPECQSAGESEAKGERRGDRGRTKGVRRSA